MPPILYHTNAVKRAQDGLGDGTKYATGSAATPNQTAKTFALTGLSIIADLGADADDKFNGYLLYFPVSGNRYRVVDWTASSDTATVYETPAANDTGACELRRANYHDDDDAAAPAFRLADGFPSILWKMRAANLVMGLEFCLPNLLEQGGFEEIAVGALPSAVQAKGVWYGTSDFAVASASALLGSRMCAFTVPGSGDKDLQERMVGSLKKGRTYGILMKCQAVTGNTAAGGLAVRVRNHLSSAEVDADLDTDGKWDVPSITTTAAWQQTTFVPDFDTDDGRLLITAVFANRGSATVIRIDEVYVWEIITVAALAVFGHNWDGTNPAAGDLVIYRQYCSTSRTGIAGGTEYAAIINAGAIKGTGPLVVEGTATAAPIYRLLSLATSGLTYQAGELLLCEKWAWPRSPILGSHDPNETMYKEQRRDAMSGARTTYKYHQRRMVGGTFVQMPAADLVTYIGGFKRNHFDERAPFVWVGGTGDAPRLLLTTEKNFTTPYEQMVSPDVKFEWDEAL